MAIIRRKWHRDDCRAVLLPGKGCNCAEMERDALRAEVTSLRHQLTGAVEALDAIRTGRAMQLRGQVNVSEFFAALDALLADAPTQRGQ